MDQQAYTLENKTADLETELKALYDDIKGDPLVLEFEVGETSINLTIEQRQKFEKISKYLDKVEGATCHTIGHTDNQGNRNTNVRLGQERADFAKSYLVNNGISASRILSYSKGSDAPIASNETKKGRSQNRRTIVTLN